MGRKIDAIIPFWKVANKKSALKWRMIGFLASPLTFHNGLYYESKYPYLYNSAGDQYDQMDFKRLVGLFSTGVQQFRKILVSRRIEVGKNMGTRIVETTTPVTKIRTTYLSSVK